MRTLNGSTVLDVLVHEGGFGELDWLKRCQNLSIDERGNGALRGVTN